VVKWADVGCRESCLLCGAMISLACCDAIKSWQRLNQAVRELDGRVGGVGSGVMHRAVGLGKGVIHRAVAQFSVKRSAQYRTCCARLLTEVAVDCLAMGW